VGAADAPASPAADAETLEADPLYGHRYVVLAAIPDDVDPYVPTLGRSVGATTSAFDASEISPASEEIF